ncbi:hypothetical protein VT84_06845 [Gemmata sp. SH-PL17]|uniref:YkvA family protein n=1 Tax=Gemmata sp. SH-PL17 TaxID=1630693 RepID=UPI00078B266D|nr:DUF1232 domain-containing protein [Gemmata sp. SH-PL17]AMV24096.1 hypothetical protein VT84_06845 [Gemmata sp. SH-PL17]
MKKAVAVIGAVFYLVSPVDLVPDVIPIIGWLDDIGVLALLANYLAKKPEEQPTK